MIKLIVSDFDGVIADCKEIHYKSLNLALESVDSKYIISREDHLKTFDGLSTRKKIQILVKTRGFPQSAEKQVFDLKQKYTWEVMNELLKPDLRLQKIFKQLKDEGYTIYVASNAVYQTIKIGLLRLGLMEYVDRIFSNEDVKQPKPHPEIYLTAMVHAGAMPSETIVIEDSAHGRDAGIMSGAFLCGVDNPEDLTFEKLKRAISLAETSSQVERVWQDNETNIVIPMAKNYNGFDIPKFLTEIDGKTLIERVVRSLKIKGKYIFVAKEDDISKYNLKHFLKLLEPNSELISVKDQCNGSVYSTLAAKHLINNKNHLMIADCDKILDFDSSYFCYSIISEDYDGGTLVFNTKDPKFSYIKTDELGFLTESHEKEVISNLANCGLYAFNHGKDYIKYSEELINENPNNTLYVSMVMDKFALDKKKIKKFETNKIFFLDSKEDIKYF